jgi:hypothetical protein
MKIMALPGFVWVQTRSSSSSGWTPRGRDDEVDGSGQGVRGTRWQLGQAHSRGPSAICSWVPPWPPRPAGGPQGCGSGSPSRTMRREARPGLGSTVRPRTGNHPHDFRKSQNYRPKSSAADEGLAISNGVANLQRPAYGQRGAVAPTLRRAPAHCRRANEGPGASEAVTTTITRSRLCQGRRGRSLKRAERIARR